ncbi:glycosyltransferase family 2 protein [Comamonas jiangduensis]|uniref:glycosyltransferase family 2 protein n=1 Tax=Comamonas jiangduensis TaxID=1194168 RepID=UPI0024E1751A|nr:glycosyltransferase family 2 protein [Comamonas jiangduensis]
MHKIEILMATYNGEKYLEAQIESILSQSYNNWQLIIHDDGSSDGTLEILNRYCNKFPEKIKIIHDDIRTGGAKNNFFHLLKHATAKYLMFSDQDDIWLPNKIELSLEKILSINNQDQAILLFTDLKVVDKNLKVISESMITYQRLKVPKTIYDAAAHNAVTGCTVMFNNALLKKLTFPSEALMHDWWLCIETFKNNGRVVFLDAPTILYRQHDNNTIGAKKHNLSSILLKIKKPKILYKNIASSFKQFNLSTGKGFLFFIYKKISIICQ